MVKSYHKQGIDMLKLGCTLPNLAHSFLHKSTNAKFYPFTETDTELLENLRENLVGGLSIVLARKAAVNEIFIRKFSDICISIDGVAASQLYPFSTCQQMPKRLFNIYMNLTKISKESITKKARLETLEWGSYPIFNESYPSKNWELLHNRISEKDWLYQRRLFRALQHSVRSHCF